MLFICLKEKWKPRRVGFFIIEPKETVFFFSSVRNNWYASYLSNFISKCKNCFLKSLNKEHDKEKKKPVTMYLKKTI